MTEKKMRFATYAIDFDDTITMNTAFPEIGKLRPHALRVMRRIKDSGGEIAIWTCRTDEHAETAKNFLASHNVSYDSFNDTLPSEKEIWGEGGRKVWAQCYIDDKGLYAQMNGGIDWLQIEEYIFGPYPMGSLPANSLKESKVVTTCLLCGDTEDTCDCAKNYTDNHRIRNAYIDAKILASSDIEFVNGSIIKACPAKVDKLK